MRIEQLRKIGRCLAPAAMEFVDRCEIVWRQMLEVFARLAQRRKNALAEPRSLAVVLGDLRSLIRLRYHKALRFASRIGSYGIG